MKEILDKHHKEYEILQTAIISALGSVVYTEFLVNCKPVQFPVPRIKVPAIKYVSEFLNIDGVFMKELKDRFLGTIRSSRYSYILEKFDIFSLTNEADLNKVLDEYMLPNLSRYIPEVISRKFRLDEEQHMFQEDSAIDLFHRKYDEKWIISYAFDEIILNLIIFSKNATLLEEYKLGESIPITDDTIVVINNKNAIAPILLSPAVITNANAVEKIKFVTSSSLKLTVNEALLSTPSENTVTIYKIGGEEYGKDNNNEGCSECV